MIQILQDISRSKGNQTIKCGQLMEHNMRNIFLVKLCTKCRGETSAKPFFKKIKVKNMSESIVCSSIQFISIV